MLEIEIDIWKRKKDKICQLFEISDSRLKRSKANMINYQKSKTNIIIIL